MNEDNWILSKNKLPDEYVTVEIEGGLAHYEGYRQGFHKWYSHEAERVISWNVTRWKPIRNENG